VKHQAPLLRFVGGFVGGFVDVSYYLSAHSDDADLLWVARFVVGLLIDNTKTRTDAERQLAPRWRGVARVNVEEPATSRALPYELHGPSGSTENKWLE